MSRDITPFALRMQPGLRELAETAAKANSRSLNSEIVTRLNATFSIEEALSHIAAGAPLNEVGQMLIDLAQERSEAITDLQQINLEVHANELREQLSRTDERLDKIESKIELLIDSLLSPKK